MFVVGDRMTRNVVTVESAETLAAAATKMKTGNFRRPPVVDSGKLVGIVSEFDLKRYADTLESTRIESAMTRDPVTVMPSETPEHAASLMSRNNVGALPVIHGSKLVGIVTAKDLHDARAAPAPRLGTAHPPLKRASRRLAHTRCEQLPE